MDVGFVLPPSADSIVVMCPSICHRIRLVVMGAYVSAYPLSKAKSRIFMPEGRILP